MRASLSLLLYFLVSSPLQNRPTVTYEPCRTAPERVDDCFSIRGRLSVYNGNPSLRLWPIGTKRLLGIKQREDETSFMPPELQRYARFGQGIYGNFEVCPLTRAKEGEMQRVCIAQLADWRVVKT